MIGNRPTEQAEKPKAAPAPFLYLEALSILYEHGGQAELDYTGRLITPARQSRPAQVMEGNTDFWLKMMAYGFICGMGDGRTVVVTQSGRAAAETFMRGEVVKTAS